MFSFLLVLARMSAFIVTWPIFGSVTVPAPLKILFSLLMSIVIYPLVKDSMMAPLISLQQLIFFVLKEVFVGLSLAFVAYMFFYGLQVGSEIISLSLGISSAQMFNPTIGSQSTAIDTFCYMIGAFVFLMINGHHMFLTGLVQSYDVVPALEWGLNIDSFSQVALFGQTVVEFGLKISAPILVSILLINISLAIVSRAVPQINVLVTSMPVNALVGLVLMILTIPLLVNVLGVSVEEYVGLFFKTMKAM
ncbi:MAG: flagellar biosynthetic protein FliR [Bdellovibrionaceae bacterium]|nr:flagellar biosynthetic protein FliR [Pseudobdellovibrionaceae bacterium]